MSNTTSGRLAGLSLILTYLVSAPLVWAQQTSSIAGVVRDTTGAVLPGVTVEASSPALIEKSRSVVTDAQGLYKIVDLRPGDYTVTFTLTGFGTVKRDGLELTTGVTATVNADLSVGGLAETITVSGQSPMVDIQNVVQQSVITTEALENLPNAKSIQSLAAFIPGLSADAGTAGHDVGGTLSDIPTGFSIHGGRTTDQHIFYDGMRSNNANTVGYGGGNSQSIFFNPAAIQEITMEVGNLSIQSDSGGVVINVIPKEGGNSFTASLLANGTDGDLQSDNLTDALRARGLKDVSKIKNIFDLNGAIGGPIVKDTLWFYTAYRRWGTENYVAGRYFSQDPLAMIPVPDLSRQAYDQNLHRSFNGRLTWQVNRKNKIAFALERQHQCVCYSGLINFSGAAGSVSPEASTFTNTRSNYGQAKWTNSFSNKLLLEAGGSRNTMQWNGAPQPGVGPDVISITELSTSFIYRAPTQYNGRQRNECVCADTYFGTFAASYVTGSHAFRLGTQMLHGRPYTNSQVNGDMTYQFFNGVPTTIVQRTTPLLSRNRLKADVAIYGQDQWTVKRLTVNLGLRYTYLNAFVAAQELPAGTFVPARTFPEVPGVAVWHNLTPRLSSAYDLFGNGKTALKVSVSKYLVGESAGAADAKNPQNTVVNSASRSWTDANLDFVPNCDLLNPGVNGECGALSDRNFGNLSRVSTTYDDDVYHGWGKRYYNWETSAGIQHELTSGVSVSAAYFRRSYGNFRINDNRAVAPSEYDPYCITAPVDARLPGGGGNQMCGFFDINPAKFGVVDNLVTFAKNYGQITDVYDGFDLTVNARLPRGAILQGGLNTGRELTDMCDVVGKVDAAAATVPFFNANNSGVLLSSLSGLASPSQNFCRVTPPFLTDVRLSGSYPLPWDVLVSATFQTIPGPPIVASYVVPNAQIAPSLGRNLAACAGATVCTATATVQLVAPYSLFGDRLNQVDLRVAKTLKVNRARIKGMLDLYNLFNASPALSVNTRYGPTWQQPFAVLSGRFIKLGLQADF